MNIPALIYWMNMQRQASMFLQDALSLPGYWPASYIVAWQERHRFCFQQMERHRAEDKSQLAGASICALLEEAGR